MSERTTATAPLDNNANSQAQEKANQALDARPAEASAQHSAVGHLRSPLPVAERRGVGSEFQQLLGYALKALARREHSTVELRRKLGTYSAGGPGRSLEEASLEALPSRTTDEHIEQVIDALVLDGSLSDERFAAEFVRMRIQKGYGPIRIRMDLLERGVPDRLAEAELTRSSEFWQQQATQVCLRKFGHPEAGFGGHGEPEHSADAGLGRDTGLGVDEQVDADDLDSASPQARRRLRRSQKAAAQRRWNRCARFLSQRGFPADLIYQTLDGRLLD